MKQQLLTTKDIVSRELVESDNDWMNSKIEQYIENKEKARKMAEKYFEQNINDQEGQSLHCKLVAANESKAKIALLFSMSGRLN